MEEHALMCPDKGGWFQGVLGKRMYLSFYWLDSQNSQYNLHDINVDCNRKPSYMERRKIVMFPHTPTALYKNRPVSYSIWSSVHSHA